ncbi:MAG: hypothetical protein AAFV07_17865, partial [Bacteroidota bacterium]
KYPILSLYTIGLIWLAACRPESIPPERTLNPMEIEIAGEYEGVLCYTNRKWLYDEGVTAQDTVYETFTTIDTLFINLSAGRFQSKVQGETIEGMFGIFPARSTGPPPHYKRFSFGPDDVHCPDYGPVRPPTYSCTIWPFTYAPLLDILQTGDSLILHVLHDPPPYSNRGTYDSRLVESEYTYLLRRKD